MPSVIHIAEIAALLAVAYSLGWAAGYLARRLSAPKPAIEIPAERLAAVTAAPALVTAPIIAPVADPASPPEAAVTEDTTTNAPEPSAGERVTADAVLVEQSIAGAEPPPPIAATEAADATVAEALPIPVAAEPAESPSTQSPAPVPVEPDSPLTIEPTAPAEIAASPPEPAAPVVSRPASRFARRFRPATEPAPEPQPPVQPVVPFSATPAVRPGEAWSGEIRGRAASALQVAPIVEPLPEPEPPAAELPTTPVEPEPGAAPPAVETSESTPSPSAADAAPQPAPEPVTPLPVHDEDAAMRAIEGGWSRVRARALPGAPEMTELGAAVAAAQTAVEQVLAQAGIDDASSQGTKPRGLSHPRRGTKDNLQRINGLGALDESTLNNLGIFHFDQIADWADTHVAWMESHVFVRGRIAREDWQRQARDLSAIVQAALDTPAT